MIYVTFAGSNFIKSRALAVSMSLKICIKKMCLLLPVSLFRVNNDNNINDYADIRSALIDPGLIVVQVNYPCNFHNDLVNIFPNKKYAIKLEKRKCLPLSEH